MRWRCGRRSPGPPEVRLAFLGPRGTFTEQAALTYAPQAELVPAPSIGEVTQAVIDGDAD